MADHEHKEGEECFMCSIPGSLEQKMEGLDAKVMENMDKYGIHIVGVHGSSEEPTFAYSVGMFKLGQPEVIILGMPFQTAMFFINDVFAEVEAGKAFADGEVIPEFAQGRDAKPLGLAFKAVSDAVADEYVRVALNTVKKHGGSWHGLLQMVWPDRQNRFPWDPEYDHHFDKYQPKLWQLG